MFSLVHRGCLKQHGVNSSHPPCFTPCGLMAKGRDPHKRHDYPACFSNQQLRYIPWGIVRGILAGGRHQTPCTA